MKTIEVTFKGVVVGHSDETFLQIEFLNDEIKNYILDLRPAHHSIAVSSEQDGKQLKYSIYFKEEDKKKTVVYVQPNFYFNLEKPSVISYNPSTNPEEWKFIQLQRYGIDLHNTCEEGFVYIQISDCKQGYILTEENLKYLRKESREKSIERETIQKYLDLGVKPERIKFSKYPNFIWESKENRVLTDKDKSDVNTDFLIPYSTQLYSRTAEETLKEFMDSSEDVFLVVSPVSENYKDHYRCCLTTKKLEIKKPENKLFKIMEEDNQTFGEKFI